MIFEFTNKEIIFTLVKRLVVLNFAAKTVRAKIFEFKINNSGNKNKDVERKKLKSLKLCLSLRNCIDEKFENSISRNFREMAEQEEIVYPTGWNSQKGDYSYEHRGAWNPLCPSVLDKNVLKGMRKYSILGKNKSST